MLIRSVTAHAFGPLAGPTLEFADAMTVVHGPNESAKSSWHAAIYAALCGRRRSRGRPSREDEDFADRHRPWDRADWVVSARLLLDDGRRVELRQDLDGMVACDAVDLDLGRDVSAEIMHDDTPDGALWLGLDRASFRATACIGQAQLLDVLSRAHGLQSHLQRAATTAAADETAVAARRRLDEFWATAVGGERAPTRPLRQAMKAVEQATSRVDRARANHAEYEDRLIKLDRLRASAHSAQQALARHQYALARRSAEQARELADEAAAVAAEVANEPVAPAGAAMLDLVAAALAADDAVPADQPAHGGAAAAAPSMVREPAPPALVAQAVAPGGQVFSAAGSPEETSTAGAPSGGARLPQPGVADDVSEEELYDLARMLDARPAVADPALAGQVDAVQAEVDEAARGRGRAVGLTAGGGLMVIVAAAVLALGPPVAAAIVAVLGLVALVLGAMGWHRIAAQLGSARMRLGGARLRAATAEAERTAAHTRFETAVRRATSSGLETDATALRERARRLAERRAVRLHTEQWRHDAGERLLAAARTVGADASTPAGARAALVRWQRDQSAAASAWAAHRLRQQHLQSLLRGSSVPELAERASTLEGRARAAAGLLAEGADEESTMDGDPEADVEALRAAATSAAQAAHAAEVSLTQWLAGVEPVGEAEEELARADAELERVRELGATLDITRRLLIQAEQTAHRTIAPRLAETVRAWLPETTAGRYTEVTIDPERLAVRVRGPAGRWRDAERLSYGTAEQIYLMLRIALAEQLARPGVRCPLLLDDVTVHADTRRTVALLELLRRASADRQIILFTQQDPVVAWAREHLTGPDHAVIELPEVTPL